MKELEFYVEFGAPPFFDADPKTMGHIDLDDFDFSRELLNEILEWDKTFQKTFCEEYPSNSGFSSAEQTALHNEWGLVLVRKIENAFKGNISLKFFPLQ